MDEQLDAEEGDKRWLSQLRQGSAVMLTAIDKNGESNAFMTALVVATPGGVFHNQTLEAGEYVVLGDSTLLLPRLFVDWPREFYYTGMDDDGSMAAMMTSMRFGAKCQEILKVTDKSLARFQPKAIESLLTDAFSFFKGI